MLSNTLLIPPVFGAMTIWLTPVWLLAAGVFVALVALALVYAAVSLISPTTATTIRGALREGFLFPVLVLGAALALFAVIGTTFVPLKPLMRSLGRIGSDARVEKTVEIPADAKGHVVDLEVPPVEVNELEITTNRHMYFTVQPPEAGTEDVPVTRFTLAPGEAYLWERASREKYLFYGDATLLYVTNNSGLPAELQIELGTRPEYPEVAAIPGAALSYFGLVVSFVLLRLLFPRVMAVATTTAKEAMAQPLYLIVLLLGSTLLLITVFIPYNTFGEDVKVLKDFNLSFVMILSIFVALWTASVGIAEEIEGRTALTVLSKPVGRPQFLLGKFVGVLLPVVLMFLILGTLFLVLVSFKVVYDARESALQEPNWQNCYAEMIGIVPGLLLAFMETVVMASISVAIATRLPMLANLLICFTIYVVGHLLPLLVLSNKVSDPYGIIQFVGRFFALVLPVLDHFNIYGPIAGGAQVPATYLWAALGYSVLYSAVAMLFALVLFEDRDVA
jgi:ABC-type transport system involved in multi-copper enzyme maturation permease subunit